MSWGNVIGAGASIFGASQASKGAKSAAQQATPSPYGVQGPAGGVSVDPRTRQIQLSMAQNPFAQMFNGMAGPAFANAAVAPGQFMYGANPEVAAAYRGTFGQGLTGEIQSQLDLLRQAAAPDERRQSQGLDDQLFARGQLGTTGGAERFRAMQEAFGQNDLQRQMAAVGMGQQNSLNRFQSAIGGVNQGMAGQVQNMNMGMGAFNGMQGLLGNLMQQGQMGVGASSGMPPGIAQWSAQQQQAPYQAGFNYLNNSGAFDKLGGFLGGLFGGNKSAGGSAVPMPNYGPVNVTAPDPASWMPGPIRM